MADKEIEIDPNDVHGVGDIEISDADLGLDNSGRAARRAQAGMSAGPKEYSDEELGLDPGAIKSTTGERFTFDIGKPGNGAVTPGNAAEAELHNRNVGLQQTSNALRAGAGVLGATEPLAALGEGVGAAVGAGKKLAQILGGATSGGGTAVIATGNPKDAPLGAALGAGLAGASQLMQFAVRRALAPAMAREAMRKGGAKIQSYEVKDVVGTVNKYEIGSIKNPQVASEAIKAGITRAQKSMNTAWNVVQHGTELRTGNKLIQQGINEFNQAQKEVQILKSLQTVVAKIANAQALQPTFVERMMSRAGQVAKAGAVGAAGAGAYKMLTGDK